MRSRVLILIVAVAACVGLLRFIFQTHGATAEVETHLVSARERVAKLNAELWRAEKTVVQLSSPTQAEPAAKPAASNAKTASPAPAPRPPGLMDFARDNPQLMNLWIANQRSRLQQRYGVLFQDLHLTALQREKFKDIHAAHTARSTDIGAAATEQGLDFKDAVIKRLHADSLQQMETELVALLGEQDFRTYQEFERSTPVRGFVDGFAVQIATSHPLAPAQAEQLTRTLIAASPTFQKGGHADPATIDWAAVDQAAQNFLSPAQFAAWKLGIAHNPMGGSRIDIELKKVYEAAKAKPKAKPPGG